MNDKPIRKNKNVKKGKKKVTTKDINNGVSREDKLIAVGLDKNTDQTVISNEILNKIYTNISNNKPIPKKKSNIITKEAKCDKVANDHPKYIAGIAFLNDLLVAMGKDRITEMTDFKGINRNDLLSDNCKGVLNNHLEGLVKTFGKSTLLYDKRNKITTYILSVIKRVIMNCGYKFEWSKKQTFMKSGKGFKNINWLEYTVRE